MSKIGKFKEVLGKSGNDRIRAKDREIVYGRTGDDTLIAQTDPILGTQTGSVLVGGFGRDAYVAARKGVTVIFDNGRTGESNTVSAKRIGITKPTSFVFNVEDRHLVAGDIKTGQVVIVIDWKNSRNRLGSIELADGEFSYSEIRSQYRNLPNYLGNSSWNELEDDQFLNLGRVGLSSSKIDNALDAIRERAARAT